MPSDLPAGFELDQSPGLPDGFTLDAAPTQATPTPPPIARPSGLARRVLGDTAVDLGKGVIGVGEAAVGLGNIVSGGYVGKGLEAIGYDPATSKKMLEEGYTPERVAANKEVADAKGFLPTIAAAIRNPSTIAGAVVESAPLMLGGGAAAQGLKRVIASPIVRSAIGEGLVGAGAAAEQTRQQSDTGLLDAKGSVAALGAGAGTAALGAVGGKVAQKLGIADVDVALAGGSTLAGPKKNILRRAAQGVLAEGVLEEMPQSAQEQMWQNYATGKPLMDGVAEASAMGAVTGGVMGGGFSAIAGNPKDATTDKASSTETPSGVGRSLSGSIDVSNAPSLDDAPTAKPDPQDPINFGNVQGGVTSTEQILAPADAWKAATPEARQTFMQQAGFTNRAGELSAMGADLAGKRFDALPPATRKKFTESLAPVEDMGAELDAVMAKPTPVQQAAAQMRMDAQVMDAQAQTGIGKAAAMATAMQADAIEQESGIERLARIAMAAGLDAQRVIDANVAYDPDGESFADLPDEVLSGYARTLLEDASGSAQEVGRSVPQRSDVDSVGLRGNDVPAASDGQGPIGSLPVEAAGGSGSAGGQAELAVSGDAVGAQAEGVGSDISVEETWSGLQVDRETRDNLAASLAQGLDPNTGKKIASAGFQQEYDTELEMLDGAIATAEDYLRSQGALDEAGNFNSTQPAQAAPAPRPDATVQSPVAAQPAGVQADQSVAPLPSAPTTAPAAGQGLESQTSEALVAPVAGVSSPSREDGQGSVKAEAEGSGTDVPRAIASMSRGQRDSFQVDKAEASRSTPGAWKIVAEAATPNDLNPERAAYQLAKFDEGVKELDGQFAGKSRGASSEKLVSAWTQQGQLRTAIAQSRAADPEMWAAYDARQEQVAALKVGDRVNTAFGGSGVITRKFGKNWRILDDDGIQSLQNPVGLTPASKPETKPTPKKPRSQMTSKELKAQEAEKAALQQDALESVEDFKGMSRADFLGKPRITSNSNAASLRPSAITSLSAVAAEPFASTAGNLTAKYSPDGSAVYDGDKVVASYDFGDTLVVDKAYRRKGIGEELVYQWRTRYADKARAGSRTKASQALQQKVLARIESEIGPLVNEAQDAEWAQRKKLIAKLRRIGKEAKKFGFFGQSSDPRAQRLYAQHAATLEELDAIAPVESVETLADTDLTPAERASFTRQREYGFRGSDGVGISDAEKSAFEVLAREESRADGIEDADKLGLRVAVNAAIGGQFGMPPITAVYLRGVAGLDGIVKDGYVQRLQDQKAKRGAATKTAGLYLSEKDTVDGRPRFVLFTDTIRTPAMAAFTAAHEVAGHHGLRSLLGKRLNPVLEQAGQNRTVKAIADSMVKQRNLKPEQRWLAIEEALADLAAAVRTKNFQRIKDKHGVEVPKEMQSRVRSMLDTIVQRIKELFRRKDVRFSNGQVRQLLEASWQAAQGKSATMSVVGANGALEQVVFHGTPHNLNGKRFSLQKIGSGEGAQAYGWGLYFASMREVADGYRVALTADQNRQQFAVAAAMASSKWFKPGLVVNGKKYYDRMELQGDIDRRDLTSFDMPADVAKVFTDKLAEPTGNLYRVDVPEDSDLLDWDKPLSGQPEKVKAALAKLSEQYGFDYADSYTGREMYRALASDANAEGLGTATGRDPEQAASELLLAAGVPGLRYLDGGSRNKPAFSLDELKASLAQAEAAQRNPPSIQRELFLTTNAATIAGLKKQIADFKPESANYVIWDESAIGQPQSALESTEDQTQSEAFKKWFGQSVVTEDGKAGGKPRLMFHGSGTEGVEVFDADKAGSVKTSDWGRGTYFTPKKWQANGYREDAVVAQDTENRRLWDEYEAAAKAFGTTPMMAGIDLGWGTEKYKELQEYEKRWRDNLSKLRKQDGGGQLYEAYLKLENPLVHRYEGMTDPYLAERAKEKGHDGIIVEDDDGAVNEIVVFKPSQIKSATANNGNFNPDNPSILESVEEIGDKAGMRGIFGKAVGYADKIASKSSQSIPERFDDAQREVARKFATFKPKETISDRWLKLKTNAADRIAQKVIDQFRPLKTLNMTAFMQAHMSKGTDGALEAVFNHGIPVLDGGAFNVTERSGGFRKVLSGLRGEHDQFLMWVVGNRAERLSEEGRERLFTDEDIAAMKRLNAGVMDNGRRRRDVYSKAAEELARYNKAFLDIAQAAGEIDAEGRKVWEDGFYVPFYRAMEGDQPVSVGQVKGLVKQKIIERLVGSNETMGDPLENILANWSHMLTASMKNMAANAALDSAVEIEVAEKLEASEKGAIWTMRDGTETYWRVNDPAVLEALNSLSFNGYDNPLMRAAGKFKRILTMGVTISPTFRIRNLMRDALSAAATADVDYNPIRNIVNGLKATAKDSDTSVALMAGGGAIRFGTINDGDQASYAKRLISMGVDENQILDTQDKLKNAMRRVFDKWQEWGDRAETVNRAVIYDRLRARGEDHLTASYNARDLMNFTSMGSSAAIRAFAQVLPFFNARLQGVDRLIRGAKADQRRFMAVAGTVAMASALLFLANGDDDDYKNLPDFVRDNFWTIKIAGTWLYIPKPFEIGAMASIVERGTELALSDGDYQAKDFAHTLASILTSQLAMNPVPQIVRPATEAAFNFDLFRMGPIDSMGQQNLAPEDRFTSTTTAGAVAAGKLTGMSPQRMEHMVRGYFGWLGMQALNASDYMLRDALDLPSNPRQDLSRPNNLFVVGDFFKEAGATSGKYVSRFYAQQAEIDELYASARFAMTTGDTERAQELMASPELRMRSLYMAGDKQISRINKQIKAVGNDRGLKSWEKAERIEDLTRLRNSMARRIDEMARGGTASANPMTDDRLNTEDDE